MNRVFTFLIFPLVLIIATTVPVEPACAAADSSPVVRLLLDENLPRVVVSGSSLIVEKLDGTNWKPVISRTRMVAFASELEVARLSGSDAVASVFRIRPWKGMLQYDGRPYRGYLTVRVIKSRLMVVSNMSLESYLVGVVNGEIDSAWPMDAVMAQVVAARSYALYQISNKSLYYDLKKDVSDQVYAGVDSEDERAAMAVRSTRGEVLYREGEPIQAFFHSSCGGSTTAALEVWGVGQPEQTSVFCGECDDAPYSRWNLAPDTGEIARAVRTLYPGAVNVSSLGIHRRSADGRILTLFVETKEGRILVDAGEFRKAMGYRRLPSTRFSFNRSDKGIVLAGEGYGHGVGLCQWGARGSAIRGMKYRQILSKYYPGADVRRAY